LSAKKDTAVGILGNHVEIVAHGEHQAGGLPLGGFGGREERHEKGHGGRDGQHGQQEVDLPMP
jgi:hypothetical protein